MSGPDDAWLLAMECRLEALKTERAGMIAENQIRLDIGFNPAYDDNSFENLAEQFQELFNEIMEAR